MLFERRKQETFNEASLNFPRSSKGKRRENFMRLKEVGRGFGEEGWRKGGEAHDAREAFMKGKNKRPFQ